MATVTYQLTREMAKDLERQFEQALRERGAIPADARGVPSRYGKIEWEVTYANVTGFKKHRVPDHLKNWGVQLITGESKYSNPRKQKKLHRELPTMLERVARTLNAKREERMEDDNAKLDRAQKDFDRGWCAHRHGVTCKLINGRFHALVRVGAEEVWQDDVEYAVSHDTLVFKSEIGKVDRWITIATLQKLLDLGVLLNPKEVKFNEAETD